MSTHTRTHVYVYFADPYLRCYECGEQAVGYHDPEKCGEGEGGDWFNVPCGHECGTTSVCPSWSPVDGCNCLAHLGKRDHDLADGDSDEAVIGK